MATFVWGGAFLVTHEAVSAVPPLFFVAMRFATASITAALLTRPRMARLTGLEVRASATIGLAMLSGYALQGFAMQRIDSGRAAFISALYVPAVPLVQWLVFGRRPGRAVWMGVVLASVGLLLLAGPLGGAGFGKGDAYAVFGALSVAAEIILIGQFASGCEPRRLAVTQCAFVALAAAALGVVSGEHVPAPHLAWVACALGLGFASAYLQVTVNWALRTVPATRATLIFALEPVWAGMIGAAAGERMGILAVAGAALIVGSIAVSGLAAADGHKPEIPPYG